METPSHHEQTPSVSSIGSRWRSESLASVASILAEEFRSEIDMTTASLRDGNPRAAAATLLTAHPPDTQNPADRLPISPETQLLSEENMVPNGLPKQESPRMLPNASRICRLHWWWFWELGGITLSVCCMIAILVLLPYLDQRPLNDWHFLMAPNTMISTFITVAKTSMLLSVAEGVSQLKWQYFKKSRRSLRDLDIFDGASRGPWGASMFIIRMASKRGALVAMLGAFVIVTSLTMEPFAQQIISFEVRRIESGSDRASFSILRSWNGTDNDTDVKGQHSMESAFMKGLVNSPPAFRTSCSSGNCTWDDFSTLGICSICADVTKETTKQDNITTHFVTYPVSPVTDVVSDGPPNGCITYQYRSPRGLSMDMRKGCSFEHHRGASWCYATSIRTPGPGNLMGPNLVRRQGYRPGCWQSLRELPTSIASNATFSDLNDTTSEGAIIVVAISQATVTGDGLAGRISGEANITECELSFCEKTFSNVSVLNGLQGRPNITPKPLNESQRSSRVGYWKSWAEDGKSNSSSLPGAWKYIADQMTFTVAAGDIKFGPGSVVADSANISTVFENIAEAMTHQLFIGPGSTTQPGTAYVQEVFVIVRWKWAILPMVLVLLGVVFLAINIWINSRDGVFLWKSSLLPLLFHGLDGWDQRLLDVNENLDMTERAKGMHARLEKNDMGSTKLVNT